MLVAGYGVATHNQEPEPMRIWSAPHHYTSNTRTNYTRNSLLAPGYGAATYNQEPEPIRISYRLHYTIPATHGLAIHVTSCWHLATVLLRTPRSRSQWESDRLHNTIRATHWLAMHATPVSLLAPGYGIEKANQDSWSRFSIFTEFNHREW